MQGSAQRLPTEELLWDAIEALAEGIALYDKDNRLVVCNQLYRDMFPKIADLFVAGARWEDLVRIGAERGQYVDALGRVEEWLADRLEKGVPYDETIEIRLSHGLICSVQYSTTSSGGFVVVNTDITERRQAEAMALEQENILRTVLDASPVAVIMAHLVDGRILYRSPAAIEFFGNTTHALSHYLDPEDRIRYIELLKAHGRIDDYRITLKNAQGKPCATTSWGRLVEFEGEKYAVTAIMDLSEQQERETMIRQVLEACPTAIQMTRVATGDVMFASPETASLFGRSYDAKRYYADPETRQTYLNHLQKEGSVSEFKAEYLNSEGDRFWGSVSARLIRYNGEDVIVSHTRDLTEQLRIESELSQQQNQLYQNEKLSAMGELLAGVAHELNNPLSVVVGHSLMLREDCKDPDTLRQIEKISQAAERCAKIVKTFLTMARQQPVKMQQVSVNDIVQVAVDVARYGDAGVGFEITCSLEDGLPMVCADPDQITQVCINLILNAEHAMRDSGDGDAITVSTQLSEESPGVLVRVADNGPGIPEDIQGRVFEPFFTTKEVGAGTGIGLALCHRILQTHNGRISLSQRPGSGTAFDVFLPLDATPLAKPDEPADDRAEASQVRILILDDETDVAELNAEILSRTGYNVDVFDHAEAALESMQQRDYALVLSDLNMPGLGGRGFFDMVARDFPGMKTRTGFITGDTMGRSSQAFLSEANRPFIEKPVSPKELRAFVTKILNDSKTAT